MNLANCDREALRDLIGEDIGKVKRKVMVPAQLILYLQFTMLVGMLEIQTLFDSVISTEYLNTLSVFLFISLISTMYTHYVLLGIVDIFRKIGYPVKRTAPLLVKMLICIVILMVSPATNLNSFVFLIVVDVLISIALAFIY